MTRTIVSLSLALLLSAACDILSPEPLEVLVSVDPPQFAVGDSSEITVTVVNQSRHRLYLSGCPIGFQVFDSAGNYVSPHNWMCADVLLLHPPHIENGGTYVWSFTWHGQSFQAWPDDWYLAPGAYRVFGVLDAGEAQAISSPVTVELL